MISTFGQSSCAVGWVELLENHLRIGLVRMERAIRERMSIHDLRCLMPHDLINSKPVTGSSQRILWE